MATSILNYFFSPDFCKIIWVQNLHKVLRHLERQRGQSVASLFDNYIELIVIWRTIHYLHNKGAVFNQVRYQYYLYIFLGGCVGAAQTHFNLVMIACCFQTRQRRLFCFRKRKLFSSPVVVLTKIMLEYLGYELLIENLIGVLK